MKKRLFSAIALCMFCSYSFAQAPKKNLHLSTNLAERNAANPNDVSAKGMIRYNTDVVNAEQRAQFDQERFNYLTSTNPTYGTDRNAYEQLIQSYIDAHKNDGPTAQMVVTLPVVVHVLWNTAAQNISDNQVLSQIQVLNEDFGRTNSDVNTHWSQAANTTIQFCLAQQTPTGAATTGIERRQLASNTSWGTNDNEKHFANGGLDAWDVTRYLNIWVCNLGSGLLGYGEFPTGTASNTFGVVILYSAFGSNYTSYGTFADIASPYDRGRTTTHEFSHCFNLYHIWGDDGGSCAGSDNCSDTPNQADATTTCYTFPHTDACTTTGNGIMFENYMDYSYDNCLNLFTTGQKTRMLAVLNVAPYNALTTSNGCQSPVAVSNDAGITAIATPNGTICSSPFIPVVTLKNWGSNALTSCTIKWKVDNNALSTYSWSGNLAAGATTSVTLTSTTATAGSHTFTCYTTLPNNAADGQASNDQLTSNFTVVGAAINLPFSEGFESSTFPTNGCTLNNPDASTTWARTTAAAKTGVASMYMDDYNYNGTGQLDYFILPNLNLASASNPTMTFQVAYQLYTNPTSNPNYSDSLRVEISTDCGTTWTSLYFKYGTNLTTTTPTYSTTLFVPTQNQWRLETIALTSYASATNAMIRFKHSCDFENQMYVDDINIQTATGVEMTDLANNVNLFPNPSNTGNFTLSVALQSQKDIQIVVTDALGQVIEKMDEGNTVGGQYPLDLSMQSNGVYFVTITAGDERSVQRIVINR
jgi:hypothetical protein